MIFAPHAATVDQWFLAFFPTPGIGHCGSSRPVQTHVAMFARVPPMKAWVWVEYTLFGFHVHLFPDTEAGRDRVFTLADGAGLICVKVQDMPAPLAADGRDLRFARQAGARAAVRCGFAHGSVAHVGLASRSGIIHDGIHEAQKQGPTAEEIAAQNAEGAADQRHATEPRL